MTNLGIKILDGTLLKKNKKKIVSNFKKINRAATTKLSTLTNSKIKIILVTKAANLKESRMGKIITIIQMISIIIIKTNDLINYNNI